MQNLVFAHEAGEQSVTDRRDESPPSATKTDKAADIGVHDLRHLLANVISSQIVPRLMMMQQDCAIPDAPTPRPCLPLDIQQFTRSLLAADGTESQLFLDAMQMKGLTPGKILLDFFAPAARRLGELWTQDECDFIQVSIGLHRLQSLMDELVSQPGPHGAIRSGGSRVLLLPAPGETHEFGIAMVGNFFRAAGWRVTASSPQTVLHRLHANPFEVVGFSLSCDRYLDRLKDLIRTARRVSKNPAVRMIVGGPAFADNPGLAVDLGADGTSLDAQGAVQLARSLLEARARV